MLEELRLAPAARDLRGVCEHIVEDCAGLVRVEARVLAQGEEGLGGKGGVCDGGGVAEKFPQRPSAA